MTELIGGRIPIQDKNLSNRGNTNRNWAPTPNQRPRSRDWPAKIGVFSGRGGSGVRAQFRSCLCIAGNNIVLNWDPTPKPHVVYAAKQAIGNRVVLNWDLTPKPHVVSTPKPVIPSEARESIALGMLALISRREQLGQFGLGHQEQALLFRVAAGLRGDGAQADEHGVLGALGVFGSG